MAAIVPILTSLFDHLPVGVIVLDASGRVVIFNKTEEVLAGRTRAEVLGSTFFLDVAPCMNVRALSGAFHDKIGREPMDVKIDFSFPFPLLDQPRDVTVRMTSFEVEAAPYALLLIEDVSTLRSVERMRRTLQDLLVHDLKNPLSSVVANFEYLEQMSTIRDAKDAHGAVMDGLDAGRRIQAMLMNLLDISGLETNTLPLRPERGDARDIALLCVQDNAAEARARGGVLICEVSAAAVFATFDREVVRRALNNLVENAIRYAHRVVVAVHPRNEDVCFEVRDDGPGIPVELRSVVFEKHTRAKPGLSGQNRGLGLTFVQLAARAHGGESSASCPPGGGTTFQVVLPMSRSVRPPRRDTT